MVNRSKRMGSVWQIAVSKEQDAAKRLGTSRQQLFEREKQLSDLHGFRGEYQRSFHEAGTAGMTGTRMHELLRFMGQLDKAIEQQVLAVQGAKRVCEQYQLLWQRAYTHAQALGKLRDRYTAEEQYAESRREQKDLDERAGRRRHEPEYEG